MSIERLPAVFLSASVPVPGRGNYFESSDVVLIRAAVCAFVSVLLGRRLIVWGGHPAITPMLWAAAEDLGLPYKDNVHLYQSRYFKELFPEDNARFGNVTYVDEVKADRAASLKRLRHEMIKGHNFQGAVFIGGMEGVFDEYEIFRELHPNASIVPIVAAGGAASELAKRLATTVEDPCTSVDFVTMFHKILEISAAEKRQANLAKQ